MNLMKKHNRSLLAVALVAGAIALPVAAQNLAIVNGKAVPKARLDNFVQQMERAGRPVPPDAQQQLKDEIIAREVLSQEARRQGLEASPEYKAQMELARESILINMLRARYLETHKVTDEQAKAEYDKFVGESGGQEFHSRHILVENEAEAKDLIAQIKKGAKFEELAKAKSKDPGSGANGGDLGWSAPGAYVPEFAAALGKLKKGQMTDAPVKTSFGYHIIRVEDTRKADMPSFDQIKPQIVQSLTQRHLTEWQEGLRTKAKIQ